MTLNAAQGLATPTKWPRGSLRSFGLPPAGTRILEGLLESISHSLDVEPAHQRILDGC